MKIAGFASVKQLKDLFDICLLYSLLYISPCSQGGFVSTQDTVVALQALSMYSQKVTKIPLNMNIDITEGGNKLESVSLNDDNALLLRTQKLARLPR